MYDFVIIGGGIVGLSTAWQLVRQAPGARILVLEKENAVGRHQSGRNSGVIHAGIYYTPGSLKARYCRAGLRSTIRFCEEHAIPYRQCGKLIVATAENELARLQTLYRRALENGVEVEMLDQHEIASLEPNVTGVGAVHSPTSGIVDYAHICESMAALCTAGGGEIRTSARVIALTETAHAVTIHLADGGSVDALQLVCCGGLMSDRLADMLGIELDFRIVPFRGEYFRVVTGKRDLVHRMIYPVPDPARPFLGVHLTPTLDGHIMVGPNAVLAAKREGYARFDVSAKDLAEMLGFAGFRRLVAGNLRAGIGELRNSLWKPAYASQVRSYCPSITPGDLVRGPSGIRAQAVTADGALVDDFLFAETERSLHVCNAPSPAATSAIPIGEHICNHLLDTRQDD